MTYEVSAAAKPPQTTPLHVGIRVDPREGNGEYRRRRASGRCAHLDRQRFATQNSLFHSTGDRSHWRARGRHIAE